LPAASKGFSLRDAPPKESFGLSAGDGLILSTSVQNDKIKRRPPSYRINL